MKYVVDLEGDCSVFIASWDGDPGRTCIIENATKYSTISSATYGLARARKWRPFLQARIITEQEAAP